MTIRGMDFKKKKRVVIKIGSSSLTHPATGNINYIKMERLVRELCNLRNQGIDVCLVSSGPSLWANSPWDLPNGPGVSRKSRPAPPWARPG